MKRIKTRLLGTMYDLIMNNNQTMALILDKWFIPPKNYIRWTKPIEVIHRQTEGEDMSVSIVGGHGISSYLFPDDPFDLLEIYVRPYQGESFPVFYKTQDGWHVVSPTRDDLYNWNNPNNISR